MKIVKRDMVTRSLCLLRISRLTRELADTNLGYDWSFIALVTIVHLATGLEFSLRSDIVI